MFNVRSLGVVSISPVHELWLFTSFLACRPSVRIVIWWNEHRSTAPFERQLTTTINGNFDNSSKILNLLLSFQQFLFRRRIIRNNSRKDVLIFCCSNNGRQWVANVQHMNTSDHNHHATVTLWKLTIRNNANNAKRQQIIRNFRQFQLVQWFWSVTSLCFSWFLTILSKIKIIFKK